MGDDREGLLERLKQAVKQANLTPEEADAFVSTVVQSVKTREALPQTKEISRSVSSSKPTVFVSSTIHDMADLRSAIKFWLEELGYDVKLSDYNDFERKPELGTFEACFDAIRQSTYYVLLIGTRRGSWFDEPNKVSVTRREYQVAYDSWVKQKTPAIICFARGNVLTALRERKEILSKKAWWEYLLSRLQLKRLSSSLTSHGSTLEDPEFTQDFLLEVSRVDEVAAATKVGFGYPAANWVTQFSSVRELADGLRSALQIRGTLSKAAILESLRLELERNLRLMIIKTDGKPFYHHVWLSKLRGEIKLTAKELDGVTTLSRERLQDLICYVSPLGAFAPPKVRQTALQHALLSGELLDYDPENQRFTASPLFRVLDQLQEQLSQYSTRYATVESQQSTWLSNWARVSSHHLKEIGVSNYDLAMLFALHDSHRNVVRIMVSIIRYLYGHADSLEVVLRPTSPLEGMSDELAAETVSEEELRNWFEKDDPRLTLDTTDPTEEDRKRMHEFWNAMRKLKGEEAVDEFIQHVLETGEIPIQMKEPPYVP